MNYHDHNKLSQSRLKLFAKDPQLYAEIYIHRTREPSPPTPAMQFGRDLEEWLFTGRLDSVVAIPDEVLSSNGHRRGKAWQEWFDQQPDGAVCLKPHEYRAKVEPLKQAEAMLRDDEKAYSWVLGSERRKQVIEWTYWEEDFMSEIDVLHLDPVVVVDLKTSASISAKAFSDQVFRLDYDAQLYAYSNAVQQMLDLPELPPVVFVAVQNTPSYQCQSYEAAESWYRLGKQKFEQRLADWKACRDSGRWVRQGHGRTLLLDPPRYAEANLRDWEVTT